MAQVRVTAKVISSGLTDAIAKEINKQLDKFADTIISRLLSKVRQIIARHIKATTEYRALITGYLRAEFGLSDPIGLLTEMIEFIQNGITITYTRKTFTIKFWQDDFEDILNNSFAYYDSYSFKHDHNTLITWLRWLLKGGRGIIIQDYSILYKASPVSRSGKAIMRPGDPGWKIPSGVDHSKTNNFLTKAFDNARSDLEEAISSVARKVIGV